MRLGAAEGKVVDLSYGGLRLEMAEPVEPRSTAPREINLPDAGLAVHARAVWTRPLEAGGKWWCGVEVNEDDPMVVDAWRRFVDNVE